MMAETRCDLCGIKLGTDIDVARHLLTDDHAENRKKLISLHTIDKKTEKELPRDFIQVLQALKVRNIRDLKQLVAKGYFKIEANNEPLAKISGDLANALLRTVVNYESRNLSPKERQSIIEVLKRSDEDDDDFRDSEDDEALSGQDDNNDIDDSVPEQEENLTEQLALDSDTDCIQVKLESQDIANKDTSKNVETFLPKIMNTNPAPRPDDDGYDIVLAKIKVEPKD